MNAVDLKHGDQLIAKDGTGPTPTFVLRGPNDSNDDRATSLFDLSNGGSVELTDREVRDGYRTLPSAQSGAK